MGFKNTTSSFFKLLAFLILVSSDFADSSSCDPTCGDIKIPYPFGIGKGCYLEKSYEIECRNTTTSRKPVPFLSAMSTQVVSISPPDERKYDENNDGSTSYEHGIVRVKIPITSSGCSTNGKDSRSITNLTGSPFFFMLSNSLVAVGCNSKVSLAHIKTTIVGCELKCNERKVLNNITVPFLYKTGCWSNELSSVNEVCNGNNQEDARCDGNRCCEVSLPNDPQQVIGINIESSDQNKTTKDQCKVAFLTDEVYTMSNATNPNHLFSMGYTTVSLGWVIQTKNNSFLKSLGCKDSSIIDDNNGNAKCTCDRSSISEISYANCRCISGYIGNPYVLGGCIDENECESKYTCEGRGTCRNTPGSYHCERDKTTVIMIGVGAGFGVLVVAGGIWWLRKFLIKRKLTKKKKKFFKRNGGLLLQKELNTRDDIIEKTRIFTSRELEKATENFSENRILGHGGQGTVYKGMLLNGRTVAVKKSKAIDEDKLQEFINEVVILSQINHRHIVKLLGCCLETEVPILVYEFIINGNLFQHIHEESDEYVMSWEVRLRIAVDIAGALSYLHTSTSSPIYHRDVKSSNILLDEKYRIKVSDFGTSRSVTIDQTHWTTVISGTVGYVDPEYYQSSQYTEKSDVYSFGVILLELVTGEKPVIVLQNTQQIKSLAEHFKDAIKKQRFFEVIDARIRDDCKPEQVMAVANLAMKCLKSKGKNRPNMREVFSELEKICISPEASQVEIHIEEEDEDEEDLILNKSETWSTGDSAPAPSIVVSSSCSDVEPLFPSRTW